MSRVYWDTNLFIYWFEDKEPEADKIRRLAARMATRGDRLITSSFTLAELLVGPLKVGDQKGADRIRKFLRGPDVELIPLGDAVLEKFASIRAQHRVKPPDAFQLASAAVGGADLFLTNDQALRKLVVDGIPFIDGLDCTALGID